jgi:hypothetical protein
MQNGLVVVCDMCGEILEGRKGTAEMHKDNIGIKGMVCLTTYDKETNWTDYTYALDKQHAPTTFLNFCADPKKNCLLDFLIAKKVLRQQYQRDKAENDNYGY